MNNPRTLTVKGENMKSMNLHRLRLPFLLKILLISTIATLIVAIIELLLEQALLGSLTMYGIWNALNENSLDSYLRQDCGRVGRDIATRPQSCLFEKIINMS